MDKGERACAGIDIHHNTDVANLTGNVRTAEKDQVTLVQLFVVCHFLILVEQFTGGMGHDTAYQSEYVGYKSRTVKPALRTRTAPFVGNTLVFQGVIDDFLAHIFIYCGRFRRAGLTESYRK